MFIMTSASILILALVLTPFTFFIVSQQDVAIVERFGSYLRTAQPGLRIKIPFIDSVVHRQSLRVHQLDVPVQTKSKDNVFVDTQIAVQFFVADADAAYNAFYQLENPEEQIRSYVFDVVRAELPKLDLDEVFDRKDQVGDAVMKQLQNDMNQYGFTIKNALVVDIDPDTQVKAAMNEINAAKRAKAAAEYLAEAERIIKVKNAEADKESKILQGEGIAGQREAIAKGLKESIAQVVDKEEGISAQDVIALINFTNYTDMLKDIGESSNTIMVPHLSGGLDNLDGTMRNSVLKGNLASNHLDNALHKGID